MLTITVFGIDWYLPLDRAPTFVTYRLRQIIAEYGSDLDANPAAVATAAGAIRHEANNLLIRFGTRNI
jgi:hypothetical protein